MCVIIYDACVNVDLPKSRQSANTLFHFFSKLKYLKSILKKRKLYPRYCKEDYKFLNDDFPNLIYPMKCFCDIYLEKIQLHCDDYGSFGIGFYKDKFIEKNIQPIQYINSKSSLAEVYKEMSSDYVLKHGSGVNKEFFDDKFFKQLKFLKPLYGDVINQNKDKHVKFLPDEQEWRYVPNYEQFKKLYPFLNPISDSNFIKDKSKEIEDADELYLKFEYEEIKYLLVDNKDSSNRLINFIWKELAEVSECDKLRLISKIIVLEDLMEDM